MISALGLYVVADGMGGHAAGEVASQEAVETIYGMVKQGVRASAAARGHLTPELARSACRLIEGAVQAATYMIFAMAELDRDKSGMGTTISAMLPLGEYAVTAQVGDSRIYQVRDGEVMQITEDHTLIAWQLQARGSSPPKRRNDHRIAT